MIPSIFEVDKIEKVDIRVSFEDFDSNLREWKEVAPNFFVSPRGVLYREPALMLPTTFQLSRESGVIEVKASSPSFKLNRRPGTRFLDVFRKLVLAGLTEKDHCLIHGGGVRVRDKMALLLGPPNSGKSTTTWALVNNQSGSQYFGDDLLICRQDGLVRPFPVASRVHSKFLKSIGRRPSRRFETTDLLMGMPNEFALAPMIRSLPFYPWARMFAEAFGPMHYENLIMIDPSQAMSMSAKPSLLFFISDGIGDIQTLSRSETIQRLRVLQQLEFGAESDLLLNLSALVYQAPNMERLRNVQESCISSIAAGSTSYLINGMSQATEILNSL